MSISLVTGNIMDVENIVHVTELSLNSLAVNRLTRDGRTVLFDEHSCKLVSNSVTVDPSCVWGAATNINGMY